MPGALAGLINLGQFPNGPGVASLTIQNNGTLTANNSIGVGFAAGTTGLLTVTGPDAMLENLPAAISVGNSGTGTAIFEDHATVTAGNFTIGNNSGSMGTLTVTGGATATSGFGFIGASGMGA